MSEIYSLALLQADKARTDFYAIESQLEVIQKQLARVPTRGYLCRILFLATASIWAFMAVIILLMR
jgi:hypothetical protein